MPNSEHPFFTVAIPTYNRADLLEHAIRGVLAQSCGDFELVIGDNCSSDETRDVVGRFDDSRIQYVRHEKNIGPLANFCQLAEAAKGRYFVLHQDDDALHRDFLQRCHEQVAGKPDVVMYASTWWRGNQAKGYRAELMGNLAGKPAGDPLADEPAVLDGRAMAVSLLFSFHFAHPTIAFRTDTLRSIGGYFPQEDCSSDLVTEARILCGGDLVYDPRPGGIFTDHEANASRVMDKRFKIRVYTNFYRRMVDDFEALDFDWRAILIGQLAQCAERQLWKILGDWTRYAAPAELQRIAWNELRGRHRSSLRFRKTAVRRLGLGNLWRFCRATILGK